MSNNQIAYTFCKPHSMLSDQVCMGFEGYRLTTIDTMVVGFHVLTLVKKMFPDWYVVLTMSERHIKTTT